MASTIMASTLIPPSNKTSRKYTRGHCCINPHLGATSPSASFVVLPIRPFLTPPRPRSSVRPVGAMRVEKPLEELYNVKVERKVTKERLAELGVSRWSVWKTGKCKLPWDWQVDQLVYIEEGEVRVVPEGSECYMSFIAGDLVRYPKWFEADLFFNDFYQERYCFKAYGDD